MKPSKLLALPILALLVALPPIIFDVGGRADTPTDDTVSRARAGGPILHRRLPAPPGSTKPGAVFRYDPRHGGPLPADFNVDGDVRPAPPVVAEPTPGEVVYSRDGLKEAVVEPDRAPDPTSVAGALTPDGKPTGDGPPGPDAAPTPGTSPSAAGTGDPVPGAPGPDAPGSPATAEGTDPALPEVVDPRGTIGDTARPDLSTEREGTLNYHAVFDPTVVPFKRNRALNAISRDYELRLERGRLEEVLPTGNQVAAGRDVFWGSVLIDAEADRDVPLPSVSPDSHILSYESAPPITVRFFKDQAGNFYVRPTSSGRTRLVFVMDAPTSYFGRALPKGLGLEDVPSRLEPQLPSRVRRAAIRFARGLGLDRSTPYDRLVSALVRYFRSFEPGEPPPPTRDIYLDLARARKGVCRHRGFAFVVTAQGLGIPAHYVFNEAHVFVEVYLPGKDPGWLRIDLGGGAERLVVHSGQDKVPHHPQARDPFDRPDGYAHDQASGHTAGATLVEGLPEPQPERRPPAPKAAAAGASDQVGAILDQQIERPVPAADRRLTRIELHAGASFMFRGDALELTGQITDLGGHPVLEGIVQFLLLDATSGKPLRMLGTASLDGAGRFAVRLTVPVDQPPGAYSVVADYMGNEVYSPCSTEP